VKVSEEDRRELLRAAREAIRRALLGEPPPPLPSEGIFAERAGVFVSLHKRGELRGCIGHPVGDQAIRAVLGSCAVAAAREDPRFPPVETQELDGIDIEISLLGPIEPVDDVGTIEVGRHGLIVEQGWQRGLLLPQVATEYHWDRETFLRHACLKAGLPRDAWQKGARLYKFEAEVFGEA
jgi:AmmeMemoRadiSam system protein A